MIPRVLLGILAMLSLATAPATASDAGEVLYLANTGLLVRSGDTKVLFDPLFRNSYGTYQLVPSGIERDLLAGEPPFDGVDAVFISHFHGDHFDAQEIVRYLEAQPSVLLFAPRQAMDELEFFLDPDAATVNARLRTINIDYGDAAQTLAEGDLLVEAFHVPHSGWPQRRPEVQNIAFRVTLNDGPVVLHMGDADTRPEHFAIDADLWAARETDMAFPPYWYFMSEKGQAVLDTTIRPRAAVGVHVPVRLDADAEQALTGYDIFRRPSETRPLTESATQ